MVDDKLDALIAEFQAIESWDREKATSRDEINKARTEARRMRRLEIVREINTLLKHESPRAVN